MPLRIEAKLWLTADKLRCLVEMRAPYKNRIFDPACGSGGMLVQPDKLVESQGGKLDDVFIYAQESNATTRRLAIRGIETDIGKEHAHTFRSVLHPNLRADNVLASAPFNDASSSTAAESRLPLVPREKQSR
jgi:type I restriction enzyme M protein